MMDSQLVFKSTMKEERLDNHHCRVKRVYRPQPYDISPPGSSRSSTGTPPSSPDQNNVDDDGVVVHKEKRVRREEANKRERTRMHTVNSAFDHLRQLVPTYPSNRKLSKIETLKLACSYIQDLTKLVNDNNIQSIHGEDVNLLYSMNRTNENFNGQYMSTSSLPGYMTPMTAGKTEYSTPPDFNSQNYCYQQSVGYVNSDAESCQSEPDVPSPTHHHYNMYMTSPGIAVRPPPAISRVSSDSIIAMQMANASIGSSSPTYCSSSSAGAPCSPLMRAQHSTSAINSQVTTLQCNATPLSSLQPFSNIHTPIFPQCYSQ